jgi:hypothetical protein
MQPENASFQPERSTQSAENPVFNAEILQGNPEASPGISIDKERATAEQREVVNALVGAADPLASSLPAPSIPNSNAVDPVLATDSLSAADDDNIEREWVKKAKETIERTRHDPRAQGNETSALKASYQEKRFNRQVGSSNEAS